jgi:putative selenium metabolism hydrolase
MALAVKVDEVADLALRLVRAESPSAQERAVAEQVEAEMRRLGYEVRRDELGNVVGTIGEGSPCVLLDAHMDTVGVTDPAAWSHDPAGELVDGRLYGRGSMDMKGPLASALHGVAACAPRLERGRLVVSATVAEELVEGPATQSVAEAVKPDFVVICEATSLRLANGQRGRAEISIEVLGRPTHSSRPELGVNAAEAMADVIVALRRLEPPAHPVLGRGVLVLTDIISRPHPGLSVVPDRCVVSYDRRTLPGETETDVLEAISAAVQEAVAPTGAKASVAIAEDDFETYSGGRIRAPNFAAAWYFEPTDPVVRLAARGLKKVGLDSDLTHYAFCTNGSGTAGRLGIPTVGFGPGQEELAHRIDEYIELDDLARAAEGYAAMALSLLGGGD